MSWRCRKIWRGDDRFKAPPGLAGGLAVGGAAGEVGAGIRVHAGAGQGDGVQGPVELAVAGSAEAVAVVSPEDAWMGAAPEKAANAASERNRPVCDQLIRTWAALIAPTPGSASSCGWAEVTSRVISRSRSSASARSVMMRLAVDRRAVTVTRCSMLCDGRDRRFEQ